jgi:FimV-like protein
MATQLDLARAYIETGKKQLAKKILEHVITQGDHVHQEEARNLLGFI